MITYLILSAKPYYTGFGGGLDYENSQKPSQDIYKASLKSKSISDLYFSRPFAPDQKI